MTEQRESGQDFRLRLALVCLLLGAYLLVYVGSPISVDGDAVLSVAASVVRRGSFDIDVINYTQWTLLPMGRMGTYGVDGALYTKKGVTSSLFLLPLVALAEVVPWLTTRATALFLSPLVNVATALVLFGTARRLGYRARTAFAAALGFGVATMALPYAKTLFGEVLAALLLLLAVTAAYRFRRGERPVDAAIIGAALGLLVGVNTIYIVTIPVLGLALLLRDGGVRLPSLRVMIAFGLPLALLAALLLGYNYVRFGGWLETGYRFEEGEGFTRPFLLGFYGLFLSPYRGLFWYNPVLLVGVWGWVGLRRRAGDLAWLVMGLTLLQGAAFASWWAWDGGVVWGPRFLLPVVPLVMLATLPVIDAAFDALEGRRYVMPLTVLLVMVVSVGVQLLGAMYSYYAHIGALMEDYWVGFDAGTSTTFENIVLFDPTLSAIFGHLRFAFEGRSLHPAWLSSGVDEVHLAAALVLVIAGLVLLLVRRRFLGSPAALLVVAALVIFSGNIVVIRQQRIPQQAQIIALTDAMQPPGTVLAMTELFAGRLIDIDNGAHVISTIAPTEPDDPMARQTWDYVLCEVEDAPTQDLWVLSWFAPDAPENWQGRWLWQNAAYVEQHNVENHSVVRFNLTPTPEAHLDGGWQFGDIVLERYGAATSADGVRITVQWTATAELDATYTWFVHLLDADGNIVAQQDRQPQGGYAPTVTWTPGEDVVDRLFFPLEGRTVTDEWRLRVGWLDLTGAPLPVRDASGERLPLDFVLLPLSE